MIEYSKWTPTGFDTPGAFLEDQQDWLVLAVMQTRDSGPLDQSNFATALQILGGESEQVQVHRFGHWGPGWFEIILLHPDLRSKGEKIEESLANYPVLDESDFCQREQDDYLESWHSYACREFIRRLQIGFHLSDSATDLLKEIDCDYLREHLFEECIPSGEYYITESSGVCVRIGSAVSGCTRVQLAAFLRHARKVRENSHGNTTEAAGGQ